MANRGSHQFLKRQKEMARQQKQKEKAERKAQRKRDGLPEEGAAEDGVPQEGVAEGDVTQATETTIPPDDKAPAGDPGGPIKA